METPLTDEQQQYATWIDGHERLVVLACFARGLEERVQALEETLRRAVIDGRLQTFEDRERFRREARSVLGQSNATKEVSK